MNSINYEAWLHGKHAEICIKNLRKHDFDAHFFQNILEARSFILKNIASYATFGFGGSDTTRQLNIIEPIKKLKKTVYDHWEAGFSADENLDIRRKQVVCDCFFCSANAISMTGEIINVDGVGNRTSAMAFGPQQVMIVAGINKLVPDLDAALRRVREVAGPMRARSLDMKTPCAETGICIDCNVPQRICRITSILHRKPMLTAVSVILINETLGF
jgi:hypothetical protein